MRIWNEWSGGNPPVFDCEPIEIKWHNGLTRVYDRGDHIVWKNLTRPLLWRLPIPPVPAYPQAVWIYRDGDMLFARPADNEPARGGTLYVRQF